MPIINAFPQGGGSLDITTLPIFVKEVSFTNTYVSASSCTYFGGTASGTTNIMQYADNTITMSLPSYNATNTGSASISISFVPLVDITCTYNNTEYILSAGTSYTASVSVRRRSAGGTYSDHVYKKFIFGPISKEISVSGTTSSSATTLGTITVAWQ